MKTLILFIFIISSAFAENPSLMKSYIEKNGKEPVQFIIEKFKDKDYVVFSETHKLKHEVDFINTLLPILFQEGISNIAIEFGNPSDQLKVDKLLNSNSFDKDLAIEILQNYRKDGIWGYQEYLDFYKTAWQINQSSNNLKIKITLVGNLTGIKDLPKKSLVIASSNNSFFDKPNSYYIQFHTALNNQMDSAFDLLSDKKPVAINISQSPIKLNCDGYVFLKSKEDFEPLTWIDNFIDVKYFPIVKSYFKNIQIETIEYAEDLCKAYDWTSFEMEKGTKRN